MSPRPTTLDAALRFTAAHYGDDHGVRFYDAPGSSQYRGYADLDARARTIGAALASAGYGPGDTVVIGLQPGLPWVDAVYGALYAGMAFVPAATTGVGSPEVMIEKIRVIARASEASVMLTDDSVLDVLETQDALPGTAVPLLRLSDLLSEGDAEKWTEPEISADALALLMFTSGSTGEPKGVIGTHRAMLASVEAYRATAEDVVSGWAPLHHMMGLFMQVLLPGTVGAQSVITSTAQFQRRPLFWLQLMSDHRATMSAAGNFAFALCTQFATDEQVAALDLSSVRSLMSGSEPVRAETVNAFMERFASTGITSDAVTPVMAMSEAMVLTAKPVGEELVITRFDAASLEAGALVRSDGDDAVEMVSCGRAFPATTLAIVDPETLTVLPEGHVGEIWVSSPTVSPGYFRRPDATAETFGLKLPGDDRDYMRSGDLAAMLDGELYVTGRLKDLIIIRGRNIYPQDIEAAARTVSPAVGVGACFELEKHPSAVGIVTEYNEDALAESGDTLDTLAAKVRDELTARFSLPSLAVAFIEEGSLPRTATGKVQRNPTRRRLENGELGTAHRSGFRPVLESVS